MNKIDFIARFRGRLLLFLTEAWSCRKMPPSELGSLLDQQTVSLRAMLTEMYDDLCPKVDLPVQGPHSVRKPDGKVGV